MSKFETHGISRASTRLKGADDIVFVSLCSLVVAFAIPFGGVDLWARMLFSVGTGGLLVAYSVIHLISGRSIPLSPSSILLPALLFSCVCFWIGLQAVQFVPMEWQHPIWMQASQALGRDLQGFVSINPETTKQGLITIVAAGVVFWLALQLGRNSRRAEIGVRFFVISCAVLALYGIVIFLGDGSQVAWMEKRFYLDSVTGTFVNRNSFATFLGLGLVCSLALLIDHSARSFRTGGTTMRGLLRMLETLFARNTIYLVASIVLLTALLLTQSRAGNASVFIGLCVLVLAMVRAGTIKVRHTFFAVLLLTPVLGILVSVSGSGLGARMPTLVSFDLEGRADLYIATLDAIKDRPLLGSGFGTYREAIYPYLTEDLLSDRSWFDAHNTYLEKALELGLPAATALIATLVLLALSCWRGLRRRRRDHVYPAIAVGISCMIAFHALLDFSIEIPAVAMSFALLLGIGVAQSFPSSKTL